MPTATTCADYKETIPHLLWYNAFIILSNNAVSDAEKAAAFAGYLHYSGTWSVVDGHVVHAVEVAMNPNLVGTRQVRHVALQGDRLELGAEEPLEAPGQIRRHRIVWRRAGSAAAGSAG